MSEAICSAAFNYGDMRGYSLRYLFDDSQYGQYELVVDPESKAASGSMRGKNEEWRKAKWVRALKETEGGKTECCEHSH